MGNQWVDEESFEDNIIKKINGFHSNLSTKWKGVHRIEAKFFSKHEAWLDSDFLSQNVSGNFQFFQSCFKINVFIVLFL